METDERLERLQQGVEDAKTTADLVLAERKLAAYVASMNQLAT
jgi:hypothetical protein